MLLAVVSASGRSSPTNRLSIAHLLLWLTMTSVVLAVNHQLAAQLPLGEVSGGEEVSQRLVSYWHLLVMFNYMMAPAEGAALCGVVAAIVSLFRSKSFPSQPGHWLLVIFGVSFIALDLVWFTQNWRIRADGHAIRMAIAFGGPAFACILAAMLAQTERRWWLTFVLLAFGYLAQFLNAVLWLQLSNAVFPGIALLAVATPLYMFGVFIFGLGAVLIDLRTQRERDILHWVGAVVLFARLLETIVHLSLWW